MLSLNRCSTQSGKDEILYFAEIGQKCRQICSITDERNHRKRSGSSSLWCHENGIRCAAPSQVITEEHGEQNCDDRKENGGVDDAVATRSEPEVDHLRDGHASLEGFRRSLGDVQVPPRRRRPSSHLPCRDRPDAFVHRLRLVAPTVSNSNASSAVRRRQLKRKTIVTRTDCAGDVRNPVTTVMYGISHKCTGRVLLVFLTYHWFINMKLQTEVLSYYINHINCRPNNNNNNNVNFYGAVTWALPKTRAPKKVMEKKLGTSETWVST